MREVVEIFILCFLLSGRGLRDVVSKGLRIDRWGVGCRDSKMEDTSLQ